MTGVLEQLSFRTTKLCASNRWCVPAVWLSERDWPAGLRGGTEFSRIGQLISYIRAGFGANRLSCTFRGSCGSHK